jgi:hypothetical protein
VAEEIESKTRGPSRAFWRMLQQIADANKTSLGHLLIYWKPGKLASRITGTHVPVGYSGPVLDLPSTEFSGSRVREKRGSAE